jgi:hypothetical protein
LQNISERKKMLVLRSCNSDMSSYNGFVWPESGPVKCNDWNPKPECGNGLHGWAWGEGDGSLGNWSDDAKWLVVKVSDKKVVDLKGKVKFPEGNVVFCGNRFDATNYIRKHGAKGPVIGASIVVGYNGIASAGNKGTASAGDNGTASAGDNGTASAGYYGTASAGIYGTATAGDNGTASAGINGTASAGNRGTASVGDEGTASAGINGTASAGDNGTASAGYYGKASAGDRGIIQIKWHDGNRYRVLVGYIGEDGLLPNVKYKVEDGKFVKAE